MKRKIVFACMISALLLLQTAMAAPNVEVNGTQIDTDAVIIDDKTYVPLRGVFEAAGAEVSWNEETQTAGINISNSLSDDELIPSVIESVSPSVVGIIGRGKTESYYGSQEGIMSGSGVIIKTGGEILTNAHVVKNMNTILVVMNDGKGYEAQLKYIDEDTDEIIETKEMEVQCHSHFSYDIPFLVEDSRGVSYRYDSKNSKNEEIVSCNSVCISLE